MNQDEINELAAAIIKHRRDYYNGCPTISDAAFDHLVDILARSVPNHYAVTSVGSPVEANTEWRKARHEIPMGSLDKVNTPEEFREWASDIFSANTSIFFTEKLDGASIELIYNEGELVQALTRGDGTEGEDIVRNVVKMSGVRRFIPDFTGSLRGEIILRKSQLNKHFKDLANPRNAATGIARRINGEGCEHLDILYYQVLGNAEDLGGDFKSEFLQFKFIEDTLKLKTPVYEAFAGKNIDEICAFVIQKWEEYHRLREERDYDIDGLVIRVNDLAVQIELGDKDMRPKGAKAFKFRNENALSRITDVLWQTGNAGTITPVAEIDPVQLLGVTVTRASLYNIAYINELKLDVGAKVLVCRANDVIPRIEEVVKGTGTVLKAPNKCPTCLGPVDLRGEKLMCVSVDTCPAQKVGRLINWVSSLNILEWGEALLTRLVESGKVKNISDLYRLSIEDLMNLERMGEKSAKKCHQLLWARNPIPLEIFLGSLSIPLIAVSTIKMVMEAGFDNLDSILTAPKDELMKVKGLGPSKTESLFNGLRHNRGIILDLLDLGVKIENKIIGPLNGMSFQFTGTMKNKRAALEKIVVEKGGQVKSVGKGLTYLVIDNPSSGTSKAVAARKLGIKLISEDDFLGMCKGG